MPHLVNHLFHVYTGLPEEHRGQFIARGKAMDRARELGLSPIKPRIYRPGEVVVVASFEDYRVTRPARVIFVNHGVGLTYGGDPKSANMSAYSGGKGRERTILYLCPSDRDVDVNRAAYPNTPAVAVGLPYLDQYHQRHLRKLNAKPVIGISFHADVRSCPETRWAFQEFRHSIVDLVATNKYEIVGHAHPRAERVLRPWWLKIGVPYCSDWWKLLRNIDCFVIDNSSTLYEAAALGIPTVAMNSKHYRKGVNHNLRFWSHIPGIQCDNPSDLGAAIDISLRDLPEQQQTRHAAVMEAYSGLVDGCATQRAVDAILEVVDGR